MDSKTIDIDIQRMLESITFQDLVRYRHDPHWVSENKLQDLIDARPFKRLESDADHSWHLADMVLLLGPHWPDLDLNQALKFAILHDKLEIFIGDDIAVGLSGTGQDSHAFNDAKKMAKKKREEQALVKYLRSLPEDVAVYQREIFSEYMTKASREAKFVDALDKLQVFLRVIYAKRYQKEEGFSGPKFERWLQFANDYSLPRIAQFPPLLLYADELIRRIRKNHF